MPRMRLVSVAPAIAPDDLSICDIGPEFRAGVQSLKSKVLGRRWGRSRHRISRSETSDSGLGTHQRAASKMQDLKFRAVADFLDQFELVFKRREKGVPLKFTFDQRQIKVGAARQ